MKKSDSKPNAGPASHKGLPPRMPGLPIVGNLFDLRKRPLDLLIDGVARYGSVFRLRIFGKNIHVITGQSAIDLVGQNDESRLCRRNLYDAFAVETGVDIFGSMGQRHKTLKQLIRLGLSRQVMAQFIPEIADRLCASMKSWPRDVRGLDRICYATAEAISTALTPAAFGVPLQTFADYGIRVMMVIVRQWPWLLFWLPHHKRQKRMIYQALDRAIELHRCGTFSTDPKTYIIDALLQAECDGQRLTDRDVRGMGMYSIMGTYIYCGRTASFMVYEILKNPKLLEHVMPEIDAAFDGDGLNAEVLRKMSCLRATFHESLRRYPIVPGLAYRTVTELVVDGYTIPKDEALLLTGVPGQFLDPGYENPWAFDSKRCMAPRNEHRSRQAFSPWGFQPRVCAAIGLVETIILTTVACVLRTLKLELPRPSYEFKLDLRPLPGPKDGFPLRVAGHRTQQDYVAKRDFLTSRQVSQDDILEPLYEFEIPELETQEIAAGSRVFEQGDKADSFYTIIQGNAKVLQTTDGRTMEINRLGAGDSFGEIGLLRGVPRTASVEAITKLKLLRLNRNQFLKIISDSDLVASELGFLIQRRFIHQTLSQAMPNLNLEAISKISSEFDLVECEPGQVLFEQGDASDGLYIVVAGQFDAYKCVDGQSRHFVTFAPGELFGEFGVLDNQPRMATIRNSPHKPGLLVRFSRELAKSMLRESESFRGELGMLASKRLMEHIQKLTEMNRGN